MNSIRNIEEYSRTKIDPIEEKIKELIENKLLTNSNYLSKIQENPYLNHYKELAESIYPEGGVLDMRDMDKKAGTEAESIAALKKVISNKFKGFKRTGALVGGMGGSSLGSTYSGIKEYRDTEDKHLENKERIKAVLRKALIGGLTGGVTGAGLGAIGGQLYKNKLVNNQVENARILANAGKLNAANSINHYKQYAKDKGIYSPDMEQTLFKMPQDSEFYAPIIEESKYMEEQNLLKRLKDKIGEDALFAHMKVSAENGLDSKTIQKIVHLKKIDDHRKKEFKLPKELTKISKEKKEYVNKYLAAGIPLTLLAGLGIKGLKPAARMGARVYAQKLNLKNYAPGELVSDYLETAHQFGKTPYNKLLKAIEVRAKKPGDRAEEIIHWDKFTGGNKDIAIDRWVDEVAGDLHHRGRPSTAKKLYGDLAKLKGKYNGELAEHMKDISNDPEAKNLLRFMAAHKVDVAKKYGDSGLAAAGVGATGLGLTAKGLYDAHKKANDESSDNALRDNSIGLAGAGLSVAGASQLRGAHKLMNSNTIGVTGGSLRPPVVTSSTGRGHIEPAEALYEALSQHPAITGGEFSLDKYIRDVDGSGKVVAHRGQRPSDNWLTTVETGFGSEFWTPPGVNNSKIWHNPNGELTFVPDPMPKDMGFLALHKKKLKNAISRILGARREYITFGPDANGDLPFATRLFNSPNIHPAVADTKLQQAKDKLNVEMDRPAVIKQLQEVAKAEGDTATYAALEEALKKNKKILAISGSSRGDHVAIRTKQLHDALKNSGKLDDYMLLSLLAESKNKPNAAILNNLEGVASFGKLPNKTFLDAQDISHAHWGSTGANSFSESMLSRTPTAFSSNNNEMMHKEIDALRATGVKDEELFNAMRAVDLDGWNKGTINWIRDIPEGEGIAGVTSPEEFLNFANRLNDESKPVLKARALRNIEEAARYKKTLANRIVARARQARNMSHIAGNMSNIAGGLLLGTGLTAGTYGLAKLLGRRKKAKEQAEQQQAMRQLYGGYYY